MASMNPTARSTVVGVIALACSWFLAFSIRAGDWPQWRGPQRDGHASTEAALPTSLPKVLTPQWKISIGSGHSSPVVAAGKLVYLDEQQGQEVVHVLEAATGQELWSVAFSESSGDEWGSGPRATPLMDENRVYVQSCRGEFACLNASDGQAIWRTSFEKDFGVRFAGSKAGEGTASRRGNNGCGIIEGDRLFLPVGSTQGASVVCFEKRSGKVLWKSGQDEAAYSSLVVARLAGVRQLVAFTAEALLGADLQTGAILWRVPVRTSAKRHAATPVIVGDTVVVNSHTIGLVCYEISNEGGSYRAAERWVNKALKINISTPVLVGGHLYSQGASKDYVCVDAATGRLQWSQPGFGRGTKDYSSTLAAGNRLLVLTEDGTLILQEANPAQYMELGRLQVCGSTWCSPAYAGGRLFVRDGKSLQCLPLVADNLKGR